MSRVLTFSRFFPSKHPRKGEPTNFIEKIYASLADIIPDFKIPNDANEFWDWHTYYNCTEPKGHTIRAGHRWKVGDKFSPRIWGNNINPKSGKSGPYQSKQIIIGPDIEVKKVWDIWHCDGRWWINGDAFYAIERLAQNDGLSIQDFLDWFNVHPKKKGQTFTGQIICWNEKINY